MNSFYKICFSFLLFSLFFSFPNFSMGEDAKTKKIIQEQESIDLKQMWEARLSDLSLIEKEIEGLEAKANVLSKPFLKIVQKSRSEIRKLINLYQVSSSHPAEQVTLVSQMRRVQARVKGAIDPFTEIIASLNKYAKDIEKLQKDTSNIDLYNTESLPHLSVENEEKVFLQKYHVSLNLSKKKLLQALSITEKIVGPAKVFYERLNKTIEENDIGLIKTWENYYLTSSFFSLEDFALSAVDTNAWLSSFFSRLIFAYPQTFTEWAYVSSQFFITLFFMGVIGLFALRITTNLPQRWRVAWKRIIFGAWIWIGLGCAIISASSNNKGGSYFGLVMLGVLTLIWGAGSLSGRLRLAVLPELEGKSLPLIRLYPPAALGVFMMFSDLPGKILGGVWMLTMLLFVYMMFSMYRKKDSANNEFYPLLERILYNCSRYFGVASLIVCLAGYPRLAILVFMTLFAFANSVTLGNALISLFGILTDSNWDPEQKPIANAFAHALAVPASLAISLVCTVPWFWAIPGARYIIQYILATDYKIGEATFDFSKIFFLIVLFFLFRSFVKLSKTSLEHLPDRMPYVERGVIPSLQTIVTYGFWVVFFLIALSLLGVSFTSLAVVAGGLSVGIGFGMQNIFNNFISGLMLIFGRTILVGDAVDVGGSSGTVRAISIRSTMIETSDKALVFIPNSIIMAGKFINWTRNSRQVRKSLDIGVAYGSDIEKVVSIVMEIVKKQEHVLVDPEPSVQLKNFGSSSLEFTVYFFIDDYSYGNSTLSSLLIKINQEFEEQGIVIPFQVIDVNLNTRLVNSN